MATDEEKINQEKSEINQLIRKLASLFGDGGLANQMLALYLLSELFDLSPSLSDLLNSSEWEGLMTEVQPKLEKVALKFGGKLER